MVRTKSGHLIWSGPNQVKVSQMDEWARKMKCLFCKKKSVHLAFSSRRNANYNCPPRIGGNHFLLCQRGYHAIENLDILKFTLLKQNHFPRFIFQEPTILKLREKFFSFSGDDCRFLSFALFANYDLEVTIWNN